MNGLQVQPGDELTVSLWNKLLAFLRRNRPRAGAGIRIQETADGCIISAEGAQRPRLPYFYVTVSGNAARILPGRINLVEPEIDGVPLSGDEHHAPPILSWKKPLLDADGRGYIALEIQLGEDWGIQKHEVKVVQVAAFDTDDGTPPPDGAGGSYLIGGIPGLPGKRVRYPLAELRRRASGRLDVFQIVQDNLAHRADVRGEDVARHFFSSSAA